MLQIMTLEFLRCLFFGMKHVDVFLTLVSSKQTEVVTSMKALLKLVEASQLSSRLDGAMSHSPCDWIELHQVRHDSTLPAALL